MLRNRFCWTRMISELKMHYYLFDTHNKSSSLGPLARPWLGPLTEDFVKIDKNLSSLIPSNITVFEVLLVSPLSSFLSMTGALLELSFDIFLLRMLWKLRNKLTWNTETNWNPNGLKWVLTKLTKLIRLRNLCNILIVRLSLFITTQAIFPIEIKYLQSHKYRVGREINVGVKNLQ